MQLYNARGAATRACKACVSINVDRKIYMFIVRVGSEGDKYSRVHIDFSGQWFGTNRFVHLAVRFCPPWTDSRSEIDLYVLIGTSSSILGAMWRNQVLHADRCICARSRIDRTCRTPSSCWTQTGRLADSRSKKWHQHTAPTAIWNRSSSLSILASFLNAFWRSFPLGSTHLESMTLPEITSSNGSWKATCFPSMRGSSICLSVRPYAQN